MKPLHFVFIVTFLVLCSCVHQKVIPITPTPAPVYKPVQVYETNVVVATNTVTQTNVVTETNVVTQTNTVVVTVTNPVVVPAPIITNVVVTNVIAPPTPSPKESKEPWGFIIKVSFIALLLVAFILIERIQFSKHKNDHK